MPTHVQVEFGLTNKIGDDSLAGFTLGEMLFEKPLSKPFAWRTAYTVSVLA